MKQTPEEKAKELFNSFFIDYLLGMSHAAARTLAIMCVDEIIKANPVEIAGPNDAPILLDNIGYWQQVKQELQKM